MSNGRRVTLASLDQKVDDLRDRLIEHTTTVNKLLLGTEACPGAITRLDRLEQSEKARLWKLRALWAVAAGAMIERLVSYIANH